MDHGLGLRLPERNDPARFGLVMAGALGVLGGWLVYRGQVAGPPMLAVAAAFAALALGAPALLQPLERAWMWLAERTARVGNTVLLTAFFFLIVTPTGLLCRLVGRDPLRIRGQLRESYWEPIPDDPTTEYRKPF